MGCVSSKPAVKDPSTGANDYATDSGKHGVKVSPKPLGKQASWHVRSCVHHELRIRIEGISRGLT